MVLILGINIIVMGLFGAISALVDKKATSIIVSKFFQTVKKRMDIHSSLTVGSIFILLLN